MIESCWAFDTRGHERTLLHIEFLSPWDSSLAGLARPYRLAQRHVWQELHQLGARIGLLSILRLTGSAAREQRVTRVPTR